MTKRNFILLDAKHKDTASVFSGAAPAVAAKKAASRGHKKILLRETGSKDVHEFKGKVAKLMEPKVVTIAGKEVKYTKEASVVKVRKFSLDDPKCK
jgi:hypothetical protein